MKKLTTAASALILLSSLSAKAQMKPGTLFVGSTIGTTAYTSANSDYSYDNGDYKTTGTNTYTFSLGPQVGVFLTRNLVFGGTLSYSLSTSHASTSATSAASVASGSTSNSTTSTVSLGPFLRCYFAGLPFRNWFYFQVNGAAGTGSGSTSGTSYSSTSTGSTNGTVSNIFTWNGGGSVGMTHFFNNHVGMDIALGYSYSHVHNRDINNTNTTNKNSGTEVTSTNNYTLDTGTSGASLTAGFHWYL